ncbi:AraC family transcriptional regulator [Labrys wisconsinensis]|uniref:AraC-like DNA-binding protein/mannose-6-phosphate isomerase-like protein (Cupin superfamily) n=1 Tax=Labrys wisconsinensis TaxID=425677 RepID=A0ABU0JJ27_9HYPH|nr:helix-turn-helix transcriptional regulator [Labrys wisconsinensis]MDQ0474290.1 AraC-like DNA-binding protein/mannose-6-phosphate isomerase-like protein (cupin superfamily) [Labrys wisconsinensis]
MSDDLSTRHLDFHAPARPMAAMEIDYPSGLSTGLHAHPSAQLLYAIAGVMVVRSAAGSWVVPPNRAAWLPAGLEHEVRMCGEVKIRTVFVDPAAAPHLPADSCVVAVSPLLRELLVAATAVPLDYAPGTRDERLMALILDELRVLDVLPLHLPMPADRLVRTVCEAMIRRPDDTSKAAAWAARLGMAPKTLHRLFRRETGLTFGEWRQQARLVFALERLAGGARIIDVALDSGYASQSAFTAMFRRHFGVPPGAFYR